MGTQIIRSRQWLPINSAREQDRMTTLLLLMRTMMRKSLLQREPSWYFKLFLNKFQEEESSAAIQNAPGEEVKKAAE